MSKTINANGQMILLLGGARAGKSSFALQLAAERERISRSEVCFIATAQALDEDMSGRIASHRSERPSHWRTIEEPFELDAALRQTTDAGVVIVDCLTLFVSNWLLRDEQCELQLRQITDDFLKLVQSRGQTIICVSNEAGLGIVPETLLSRTFRDWLGRVNQQFA
ncbi:MAG: bifunctional adenosylcobinamide kinase/adenosylcobinamide-phosphate guanylyltransferase, partial [Pyrinomonadaceae bacterium]